MTKSFQVNVRILLGAVGYDKLFQVAGISRQTIDKWLMLSAPAIASTSDISKIIEAFDLPKNFFDAPFESYLLREVLKFKKIL
ncbi:MAG: hypothetical protein LBT79_01660 [Elusimicrobiota bacterium]|jgi:hypothetical protein|nr:hypothetical protein [Elusimicrobiota bacterium]